MSSISFCITNFSKERCYELLTLQRDIYKRKHRFPEMDELYDINEKGIDGNEVYWIDLLKISNCDEAFWFLSEEILSCDKSLYAWVKDNNDDFNLYPWQQFSNTFLFLDDRTINVWSSYLKGVCDFYTEYLKNRDMVFAIADIYYGLQCLKRYLRLGCNVYIYTEND